MRNIKLTIAYDGKNYLGWQKTQEGPSIEETLEKTLHQILQRNIILQAASRTDARVHAQGQVVNFFIDQPKIDLSKLCISINQLLPDDIAVIDCEEASPTFHPTLSATGKTYHYYVCNSHFQLPHHRLYSWHCHYPLDLTAMRAAAALLIGTHDFSSFKNQIKHADTKDCVRTLTDISIECLPEKRLYIAITGNSFLYQMVRNIVGTLIYIGRKKIELSDIPKILASKDRTKAGPSAPAHGLFLHQVHFE